VIEAARPKVHQTAMRILYSHRVQSRDGQSVHIDELVRAFRAAGHTVNVVGPASYEKADYGGNALVQAARRLLPPAASEWAELAYDRQATSRLRSAALSFKPDLIYERCNLFFSAGASVAKRTGTLFYLEVNSPLALERQEHGGLALAERAAKLERDVWCAADRVLPVTGVLGNMLIDAGVQAEHVAIIPNGVNLSHFPARPARDPAKPPAMVFVGFVRPWHGLDRVIEGMAASRDRNEATLTIVGDGPARPDLEALAARLDIADRVIFTGVIPPKDVGPLLTNFDIALQPQATPYASPLKIFDYMAAGCAIVAPDQPNIREVLKHNRTAVLFDPAEPQLMWNALHWLIEEPALRTRLGQAARTWIERENRTWDGNAARITTLAEQDLAYRAAMRKGLPG
jgi:glycosyltransferase involved in cell wall biosynthesis